MAIPFGEWRPDMPDLSQWAREALNVVPLEESYGPFNSLATTTNALTARAQGAAWFRCPDQSQKMFAGDATKLYLLSNGTTWGDVSRTTGGAYTTGGDGNWRFDQFGPLAIATNGIDVPQKFDLQAGSKWLALGGSPPIARFIGVVKDFLVLGNLANLPMRLQWCGINNAEDWGAGQPIPGHNPATQADYNDEPDGGAITGILGGEYGVVFQESAVRLMTYTGPSVIFEIDKVAKDLGATVPNSIAGVADLGIFLHQSGFHMIQGGRTITPIGRGKVDKTFWKEFDQANHFRSSAAFDPARGLYVFAYPVSGSNGTPTKAVIYNVRTEKWSHVEVSCELIYPGISQKAWTIEDLDVFGSVENVPFSFDSPYWLGAPSLILFGFDTTHKAGAFNGQTMAATLETNEVSLGNGRRVFMRGCRPLVDAAGTQISLGYRENQQTAPLYTPARALTGAGLAPLRRSTRYTRFRATIPAGASWQNAQGIDDVAFSPVGGR
jgi:hypothetical protein